MTNISAYVLILLFEVVKICKNFFAFLKNN